MLDKKNFYINGEWIKPNSSEEINVINPATEENCAVITLGNKADINLAVNAAKDAYESRLIGIFRCINCKINVSFIT